VVIATILFSLPDLLGTIGLADIVAGVKPYIPLSQFSLGWVLPALVVFVLGNTFLNKSNGHVVP